MFERLNKSAPSALAFRISRPLSREEVKIITDELEGTISASGKARVLLDLQVFPYEHFDGLWEDLKFNVTHARDIERLALVGDGEVVKWSLRIFSLLTFTKCHCFQEGEVDEAWAWLTGN